MSTVEKLDQQMESKEDMETKTEETKTENDLTTTTSSSSPIASSEPEATQTEEAPLPEAPKQKTYWSWFENNAKGLASKAQEIASVTSQAAAEKAAVLAKQANDFRQNYDMEVATSILMSSIGVSPLDGEVQSAPSSHYNNKKSALNTNQLDLIYVSENLIGMAFPYDPKQPGHAQGGNDINAVSNFLNKRHQGHYMVWNVSEEPYNYALFSDQVLEYKFPGHPAPPLGLLFKICTSVESWLDADEANIAVIHCLTGKGRTAALMACILTWIGEFSSPLEALQYVAERKSISVDFLTIPSQRRYVQYFSNMLDGVKPRSEPLLLRRVIINSIPIFGDNGGGSGNIGCCPYIQLFKCGKLVATAAPPTDNMNETAGNVGITTILDIRHLC